MMSKDDSPASDVCPVDPAVRSAWLAQNQSRNISPTTTAPTSTPGALLEPSSCSSSTHTSEPTPAALTPRTVLSTVLSRVFAEWPAPPTERRGTEATLSLDRTVSTIPRAVSTTDAITTTTMTNTRPANSERESGFSPTGNWIYPSEKMFFEAMRRKGYATAARDMKTVVPIHNAVNERAWCEIKAWERPYGSEEECGGPKLLSFSGMSTSMTPKARLNTWLGYVAPFDRHDWMVDRCGKQVEYVIDFYAGKDEGNDKLNFFLDVRPKLNSWEGCKMRIARLVGLV
ncbi:hypothetical protein K3495_g11281 [Podosphaera aphanis]|nr:hypothetical protein K3495_g11281 [Podosphaera aphanis]